MFRNSRTRCKGITSDVRLTDFANSNHRSGCVRLKKNSLLDVSSEVKLLNDTDDGRAWDLKLDDLQPVVNDETEDVRRKGKTSRKITNSEMSEQDKQSGIEYPSDIWFLISEYISPEDVGRFAGICQATNAVVKSANFWFSLYNRYHRDSTELPEWLQPACLARRYRLRALVIQFLYHSYPLFVARTRHKSETDMTVLLGRSCIAAWSKKEMGKANQWVYSFKLKSAPMEEEAGRRREKRPRKPDLLAELDDINANGDEGCKLLQVRANAFYPLPMVTNQKLLNGSLTIESSYHYRRLVLHFGVSPSQYQTCSVDIHSVICTRVLDWWEPDYLPCQPPPGRNFAPFLDTEFDFAEDSF